MLLLLWLQTPESAVYNDVKCSFEKSLQFLLDPATDYNTGFL